jgi:hypothetical protein
VTPTIGRIVHTRVAIGTDPVPAIITEVYPDGRVDACAFNPYPTVIRGAVVCADEVCSLTRSDHPTVWWPPRVSEPSITYTTPTVPTPQTTWVSVPETIQRERRVVETSRGRHVTLVKPDDQTVEIIFQPEVSAEERGEVIRKAYEFWPDARVTWTGGKRT